MKPEDDNTWQGFLKDIVELANPRLFVIEDDILVIFCGTEERNAQLAVHPDGKCSWVLLEQAAKEEEK